MYVCYYVGFYDVIYIGIIFQEIIGIIMWYCIRNGQIRFFQQFFQFDGIGFVLGVVVIIVVCICFNSQRVVYIRYIFRVGKFVISWCISVYQNSDSKGKNDGFDIIYQNFFL